MQVEEKVYALFDVSMKFVMIMILICLIEILYMLSTVNLHLSGQLILKRKFAVKEEKG